MTNMVYEIFSVAKWSIVVGFLIWFNKIFSLLCFAMKWRIRNENSYKIICLFLFMLVFDLERRNSKLGR